MLAQPLNLRQFLISARAGALALLSLLASGLVLAACATPDQQLRSYESSVREEADWLWNNLNYCRTHLEPDPEMCRAEAFTHDRIILAADAREKDPPRAGLVDYLDYASALVQDCHRAWNEFCAGQRSAISTASYLEARLTTAYDALNQVRRATEPQKNVPAPGST